MFPCAARVAGPRPDLLVSRPTPVRYRTTTLVLSSGPGCHPTPGDARIGVV